MLASREHEPRARLANRVWFDAPPETVPGIYSGVVFGRLTAIGKIAVRTGAHKTGSNAKYLVRCQCGTYETRAAPVVRSRPDNAMCRFCEHTKNLRAGMPEKKATCAVGKQQSATLFDEMQAVAKAAGLSWITEKRDGRTFVAVGGAPAVSARALVELGSVSAFCERYRLGDDQ